MKTEQEQTYNPITITLETRVEAQSLFDLVDKVNSFLAFGHKIVISKEENDMLTDLSDALTRVDITI